MKKIIYLLLLLSYSCSDSITSEDVRLENVNKRDTIYWNVSKEKIIGKFELFPQIDSISFISNKQKYPAITDNHRVALVNIKNKNYVFLFGDLGYFEAINFNINGYYYAITHCPITNTTITFELNKKESITPSGYRYNDNLVFYNSFTQDFISQMLEAKIGGKNSINKIISTIPTFDTTWLSIKNNIKNKYIAVINDRDLKGFNNIRNYQSSQTNNWEQMSVSLNNNKIKRSIDILEIKEIKTDIFTIFTNKNVIIGVKSKKIIRIFESNKTLNINNNANFFKDTYDNKYDWNGYCFSGIYKGKKLKMINNYIGSTRAFYSVFNTVNTLK